MKCGIRLILSLLTLILMSSCHHITLAEQDQDYIDLTVYLDWSEAKEPVPGMTVYFYPRSGGNPYHFLTNYTDSITVQLPADTYDMMIYSLSEDEYSSLTFSDLNTFQTARVRLNDLNVNRATASSGVITRNAFSDADRLLCSVWEGIEVTDSMQNQSSQQKMPVKAGPFKVSRHYTGMGNTKPRPVLRPVTVKVNVRVTPGKTVTTRATRSTTNIAYVKGVIRGLSDSALLGLGKAGEDSCSIDLTDWVIQVGESEDVVCYGQLVTETTVYTFGRPGSYLRGRKPADVNEPDDQEHRVYLDLEIVLTDGDVISQTFDVTDQIIQQEKDDQDDDLDIIVGAGSDDEISPDNPVIDITMEEDDGQGGFKVSVTDWGNPENVNVVLKNKKKQ